MEKRKISNKQEERRACRKNIKSADIKIMDFHNREQRLNTK